MQVTVQRNNTRVFTVTTFIIKRSLIRGGIEAQHAAAAKRLKTLRCLEGRRLVKGLNLVVARV